MFERKHLKNLKGYVSGIQPTFNNDIIKLNSNENPYPPSSRIMDCLKDFNFEQLRFYPSAKSDSLRECISKIYDVEVENIFCGNGSDEIISLVFKGFFEENSSIILPYPTYTLYETIAKIQNVNTIFINTDEDFSIDIDKILSTSKKATGVVIVNPNAPTGILLSVEKIKFLLNQFKGLVILDEAYIDFADENSSCLNLIKMYPNLIVLRTLSKSYSLCGIRLGYCFASKDIISVLDKIKDSYNIDTITQLIAEEGLKDRAYFNINLEKVKRTRIRLENELVNLGFKVYGLNANFLLCKPENGLEAKDIYDYLVDQNIFIRYFNQKRLADKLRISIGTGKEIDILLSHLNKLVTEREMSFEPNF
ncbi:histidinol-phosphate transaminase [Lysinibacillus fusiformis]|nr:histidinol-phosphate transaminase [Lysinibacillus fusiformis]